MHVFSLCILVVLIEPGTRWLQAGVPGFLKFLLVQKVGKHVCVHPKVVSNYWHDTDTI